MNNVFFKSVLCPNLGRSAVQCGLLHAQIVHFFVKFSEKTLLAGTATLSDYEISGKTSVCCRIHDHDVACSRESNRFVVLPPKVLEKCKILSPPCLFIPGDGVLETADDFCTSRFHAWDSSAVRAMGALAVLG